MIEFLMRPGAIDVVLCGSVYVGLYRGVQWHVGYHGGSVSTRCLGKTELSFAYLNAKEQWPNLLSFIQSQINRFRNIFLSLIVTVSSFRSVSAGIKDGIKSGSCNRLACPWYQFCVLSCRHRSHYRAWDARVWRDTGENSLLLLALLPITRNMSTYRAGWQEFSHYVKSDLNNGFSSFHPLYTAFLPRLLFL